MSDAVVSRLTWGYSLPHPPKTAPTPTAARSIAARASTLDAARAAAAGSETIMVIGGAIVYRQCLALARRIHLTLVHAQIEGDTFFDGWRDPGWRVTQSLRHEADAQHAWAYSFITLERSAA